MANKDIYEKLKEGRIYRDTQKIECRTAADGEQETYTVTGYATTFNEPYELYSDSVNGWRIRIMEQVDPGAFDDTDMSDVIMQYDHAGRVFARNRNGTLTATPDERGLFIKAYLSGTELGRQVYDEIRGGYTDKMSFGFTVAEDSREETRNEETREIVILRTIKSISKLWDVSAVSIPANDGTTISARAFGDGVITDVMQELQEERRRNIQLIQLLTEV